MPSRRGTLAAKGNPEPFPPLHYPPMPCCLSRLGPALAAAAALLAASGPEDRALDAAVRQLQDAVTPRRDASNLALLMALRQMRDLRRYSVPVTINNPKQVNIAADGGQQVNAVKVEE